MTIDHKIIWNEAKDYLFITLGLAIYTVAFTVFLMPYQIVAGGVTGLSAIIYYATGFHLENTYIIINGFLLIVALKILGVKFLMKTIFAIFMLYFMLAFAQDIIPKQANGLPFKLMGEGQDFMSMIIGELRVNAHGQLLRLAFERPFCEEGGQVELVREIGRAHV